MLSVNRPLRNISIKGSSCTSKVQSTNPLLGKWRPDEISLVLPLAQMDQQLQHCIQFSAADLDKQNKTHPFMTSLQCYRQFHNISSIGIKTTRFFCGAQLDA